MRELSDILGFTCQCLGAGFAEKPRKRRPHEDPDAPTGPLWKRQIPGARKVVPYIMDFARRGGLLEFKLNDRVIARGRLLSATPHADAVQVIYEKAWLEGDMALAREFVDVPYPEDHPEAKPLCNGEWTKIGAAEVRFSPEMLIPRIGMRGESAVISWPNPPVARYAGSGPLGLGILRRWSTTSIKEIELTETGAKIRATGVSHWVIPDLEFPE